MAIVWNTIVDHTGNAKPTYEGAVLGTTFKIERVMSDVYASIFYAEVWTGSSVQRISYGNDEFGCEAVVTADATPEVLLAVAAWRETLAENARIVAQKAAERAEAERALLAKDVARDYVFAIRKGVRVKTVARRGRNAPTLGTEGVVFWTGTSGFGTDRLGFKTDTGETVWTTLNNCQAIVPGYDFNVEPAGGWENAARALKEKAAASAPRTVPVGARVTLSDGYTGLVFWTKGTRCGAKVNPSDRKEEARWFNADEVQAVA